MSGRHFCRLLDDFYQDAEENAEQRPGGIHVSQLEYFGLPNVEAKMTQKQKVSGMQKALKMAGLPPPEALWVTFCRVVGTVLDQWSPHFPPSPVGRAATELEQISALVANYGSHPTMPQHVVTFCLLGLMSKHQTGQPRP